MALFIIIIEGLALIACLVVINLLFLRIHALKSSLNWTEELMTKHLRIMRFEDREYEAIFPVVPGTNGEKVFYFEPKTGLFKIEDWRVIQKRIDLTCRQLEEDDEAKAEEGRE
ncbi:MAG: hypothetical protein A3J65_02645 [Candidatus Buchananbacteria bacterium RIFCSPHIGHO2_02_FULL_45_11b]|uniref:Uncharacterized protein n=2 Tax=Candidatus Buchananiibacteriota TaxID=1817903 RepID=A0A1G1YEP1_9BACT|nr:MAG: hypothetical protein A3J65_02645 [Candidatus Buchananbacteria bacterium RIFCSPHIGHO2_02_FULL_45_11b]OGY55818.1 MAG: hypothetical protein A3H67_01390 [Candidatus Buchananbacteria bacterium RIFCSPLOWO2_02_FULL_46_11b]